MNIDAIRQALARCNQPHLLTFWDELDDVQRSQLVTDLAKVDLGEVTRLIPTHVRAAPKVETPGNIEPAAAVTAARGSTEYDRGRERGARLIAKGRVAAMVVAGGQGTRLGFDGPKGMFEISPVKEKSLFRLFAESIEATQRRYGGRVPWYVMTSESNDEATRTYFARHDYFGLNAGDVVFFVQGSMPALDGDGKILLDQKHRLALSPDGHGGSLRALAASGALADMATRGIEAVSYFQVDNPLVTPVDPLFVGLHAMEESEVSTLAVPKVDDVEKVGNLVRINGKTCVIEYSDLPEHLARAKNPDGSRRLDAGSIAVHVFSRRFLEQLTAGSQATRLPWHRALKKVPYVDLKTGKRMEPDTANAVKLEMFVFDTLPLAGKTMVLKRDRAEVFSPVKNVTGVDSAATARRDMVRRAARWLSECGVDVPYDDDGEPAATVEISPLLALDTEQLAEALTQAPAVPRGGTLYLE